MDREKGTQRRENKGQMGSLVSDQEARQEPAGQEAGGDQEQKRQQSGRWSLLVRGPPAKGKGDLGVESVKRPLLSSFWNPEDKSFRWPTAQKAYLLQNIMENFQFHLSDLSFWLSDHINKELETSWLLGH